MADQTLSALGPLFGPNFILITVRDDTGTTFALNIYPDANNPLLKANRLPTHYYFMPQRIYLAKKQNSPADYDFAMTIFKGLMTSETTIGVNDANTTDGELTAGGGICTFSSTFAIPDSVIKKTIQLLKNKDYPVPAGAQRFIGYFNIEAADPEPELGIVPILENNVTIEVPALQGVGDSKTPFFIDAKGTGKGSIEAQGISSFLVTCNQLSAGAIGGMLKQGLSPFTVHYNLKQQFYLNACDIHMIIDVDKVYDSFSFALSTGGFLGINSASMQAAYQSTVTSGGIQTIIKMDGAEIPDDLKKMIEQQVAEMQKQAFDLVKTEIFDWKPTDSGEASTDRGIFSSIFGGSAVSLKMNYQKKSVKMQNSFRIDTTVAIFDTVSGDLNDLQPAIKANLDKYFAIVDIGQYFQKLQVAATNNINWTEKLPDGTELADPITSAQIEVGYLDYDNPLDANGKPNLQMRAQGFHYILGQKNASGGSQLASWTANNPRDVINISFMRLDKPIKEWNTDQVKLRKTIVFNSDDPRVELASGGTTYVKEEISTEHAPVITPQEVGYIFVKFMLDRVLPKDNVTLSVICSIGSRTDTITITKGNQKNAIWEIFSDKYIGQTSFQYQIQAEVVGPNFTDPPVQWQSDTITAPLPTGRIKYINPFKLALPAPPDDQVQTINKYIQTYQTPT